jgi:hypothetical protein
MKRTIIYLGICVGLLAGAIAIMNLMSLEEKEIVIISEQKINAPVSLVYDKVSHFKNFPSWSPYRLTDPEQKYKITGTDGQVGAKFHWEGVKETSEGFQEIVGLEEDKEVKVKCNITVPFEAKPAFNYYFIEKDNGTIVRQEFKVKMGFPANIIAHFTDLKTDMKFINEKGLSLLKTLCEGSLAKI